MNNDLDRIDQTLAVLETELDQQRKLGETHARKQAEYKSAHGKKILESKMDDTLKTVSDREAWVDTQLETEFLDMKLAEAVLDAQKERTRSLRSILSALQSLSNSGRI